MKSFTIILSYVISQHLTSEYEQEYCLSDNHILAAPLETILHNFYHSPQFLTRF